MSSGAPEDPVPAKNTDKDKKKHEKEKKKDEKRERRNTGEGDGKKRGLPSLRSKLGGSSANTKTRKGRSSTR